MFEHFGIMDIWAAFRRYITIISVVVLCSALVFGVMGALKVKELFKNAYTNNSDNICISTSSYYIEPSISQDMVSRGSLDYYRYMPDDFEALINSDACVEYIYNRIMQSYDKTYIIKNSKLGRDEQSTKPNDFNALSIKSLFRAERFESTMLVNVYSYSYDEKLSDDILIACEEYLSQNIIPNLKNIDVKYTGNSKKILSPAQLSSSSLSGISSEMSKSLATTNVNYTKSIIVSLIKNVAIPVFLVCILCLMALFLVALFNPTLNRKSDFSKFGIPVIAEIKNKGKIKELK